MALVRSTASLTPRPGLTIVTGSPLSKPDIRKALTAASTPPPSAAIFTLNIVRESDSPFAKQVSPPRFLADSCANACEILEEVGVHRIVVMSTAGVGDSWGNLPLLSKMFLGWTNVKLAVEDHGLLDKEIRETNMNFTLVRAVRLNFDEEREKGAKKEARVLSSSGEGMRMSDSVSVQTVAQFLLKVATEGMYSRSAVVVTN